MKSLALRTLLETAAALRTLLVTTLLETAALRTLLIPALLETAALRALLIPALLVAAALRTLLIPALRTLLVAFALRTLLIPALGALLVAFALRALLVPALRTLLVAFTLWTLLVPALLVAAALRTLLIHGRIDGVLLIAALCGLLRPLGLRLRCLLRPLGLRLCGLLFFFCSFHFRLGLGNGFFLYRNGGLLPDGRLLFHRLLRFWGRRFSGLFDGLCFRFFRGLFACRDRLLGLLRLFLFRSILKYAVIPTNVHGKITVGRKHLHQALLPFAFHAGSTLRFLFCA